MRKNDIASDSLYILHSQVVVSELQLIPANLFPIPLMDLSSQEMLTNVTLKSFGPTSLPPSEDSVPWAGRDRHGQIRHLLNAQAHLAYSLPEALHGSL